MASWGERDAAAFSLIEMLVVIAIIAILTALIIGLTQNSAEKKVRSRVEAELAQLETVIDHYKEKQGFYPPSNPDPGESQLNPLYYELVGTVHLPAGSYQPLNDPAAVISPAVVKSTFGVDGFINSGGVPQEVKNYFPNLKESQTKALPSGAKLLVVPADGPAPNEEFNPWHYNAVAPTHNPNTYDLWAVVVLGNKTITIGNWKQ